MKPLVIFDCDGVLVDSEAIASAVLAEHLATAGFPYTQQDCRERFTGLSLSTCQQLIETENGKLLAPNFFVRLQQETFARFTAYLQPVAGIMEVLEFLREMQWDFCVASSGSHDKMAHTLGITGLQRYFVSNIFSASEVACGKPAPDLFLHAASQLDVAPHHCIVVEDSVPGVNAALAAGMQVCAFGAVHTGCDNTQVFTDMAELPAIISSFHARMLTRQEY